MRRPGIITTVLLITLLFQESPAAGKPAARIGDMHSCPLVTNFILHVGGPLVAPAVTTVLICGEAAANTATHAVCIGSPDQVKQGSSTVLIGGRSAARKGDSTLHGGTITHGCATVLIGP